MDRRFNPELARELEKNNEPNVVRSFILKAKTKGEITRDLESGKDVADLFFMSSLWMRRSGDQNEDQVMPVGGRLDEQELPAGRKIDLDKSNKEEILRKTHLRAYKSRSIGVHNYSFHHSGRGTRVDNRVAHFVSRVLPTDIAYPLNPEIDKIKSFEDFDLDGLSHLVVDYETETRGGDRVQILDSFIVSEQGRKEVSGTSTTKIKSRTKSDRENSGLVLGTFLEEMQTEEMEEKKRIMNALLVMRKKSLGEASGSSSEEIQKWQLIIDGANDYYSVQELWAEFAKIFDIKNEEVLEAVTMANIEEEISHIGDSKQEALLRFMDTLFLTREWNDEFFEIASENPHIADYVAKVLSFVDRLSAVGVMNEEDVDSVYARVARVHRMKDETTSMGTRSDQVQISNETVKNIFREIFGIKNDPSRVAGMVDSFLNGLASQALSPNVEKHYGTGGVYELNEISGASLLDLFKMAVYGEGQKWMRERFPNPVVRKRIIFEARRKLVLMSLSDEVMYFYDRVLSDGRSPISGVLNRVIEGPDVERFVIPVYEEDEAGKRHIINYELAEDPSEDSEKTILRQVRLKSGDCQVQVSEDSIKGVESVLRKYILFGLKKPDEILDVNRRSIVVDSGDEALFELDERSVEVVKYEDGKKIIEKNNFQDVRVVFEIMDKISSESGGRVKFLFFRPSTKMATVGPGGNEKLHFAKFYIEHTGNDGKIRYEEVQIFVRQPGSDKSAFLYEREKKEDDERYSLERLVDTKGLRSFIELLWPADVYGEVIRSLQRQRRRKKK